MALSRGSGKDFTYKRRSADAVKKRADQDGGGFDSIFKSGTDTFRPAQGMNTVRFIPPTWEDAEHYGFDVWVHQYVGADSGSYVCPKKMLDKRCPICEAQEEANAAGEEEEAKGLKAVKKVVAYIIDRDDKKPIPKLWTMSWTMDRDISTLCHSEKTGKTLLLDDPEVGYDVSFKRTGQQLNTRYLGLAVDREDSPLLDTQKEINKLMAEVAENPIPDLLLYKPEAYLEKVVNGATSKKDKDPDEDEQEDTGRSRRRGSRDEAEDGEEERPSRRRARDPDPDDGEEEPAPRRRRAEPEEEPERPSRRRGRDAEEDEPEEPAPRRRRSEPEPEEEERPARRRARDPEPDAADDEPEERPSRRRRSEPEDEPADEPAPRRRRSEPEPEEEERPSRRRRSEPEPEDEPAPRRRRAEPEEEEEPAPRRRRAEPEEEEEERPRRRR